MINKTQLNKFRSIIEKNKLFLDGISTLTIDSNKKYSISVSMTILMEYYSLNQLEAFNSITDDGDDNKIDAFYFSDDENEISELVVIQSKYKQNDGETNSISIDEMKLCMENCIKIINGENFAVTNSKLANKIKAFRELLLDNGLPTFNIKLFFATNGIIHEPFRTSTDLNRCFDFNITPIFIDATSFGHSVSIEFGELFVNIKDTADKTDSIFSFENEHYSGRVVSCTIDDLMKFYKETGERLLLNSNVRYLIKNSTINKEIRSSFINDPSRFCYLNNGITIISSNFEILPTGHPSSKVLITKPSVVNGGQTIATLYNIYTTKYSEYETQFKTAKILLRIYKTPSEYSIKIAQATNSQNPINIVDLKSNDTTQDVAKKYLAKYGVGLLTKLGEDITYYNDTITNENILQIYASLYKEEPSKAKTSKASTFKLFYDEVFSDTIDESMCKKLYRCYEVSKFINGITYKDSVVIKNAFYSLIYAMKKFNNNLLNENIPSVQILTHFQTSFDSSYKLVEDIIAKKQTELKSKFSLNNLFKGSEIKALIDLSFEEV
ncbi:MAG: AIPR family protein [Bacteroidota bacterium]